MPPALIGISEFVEETRDDYNSPTTSTFASRMPDCRQTISILEEVSLNPLYTVPLHPQFIFSPSFGLSR